MRRGAARGRCITRGGPDGGGGTGTGAGGVSRPAGGARLCRAGAVTALPWLYFAALAAGLAYGWRVHRGRLGAAYPDLAKLNDLRRLGIRLDDPQDVAFTLILWTEP